MLLGELFTWGANVSGQLGQGDTEPSGKPRVVKDLRHSLITAVACGAAFTLALTSKQLKIKVLYFISNINLNLGKGEIYAFGDGSYHA